MNQITDIIKSYETIRNEIKKYNKKLLDKKIFVVANKKDAEGAEGNLLKLRNHLKNEKIFVTSALNKDFVNILSEIEKEYEHYKNRLDSTVEVKVIIIKEIEGEKEAIIFRKIDDGR